MNHSILHDTLIITESYEIILSIRANLVCKYLLFLFYISFKGS